MQLGVNFPGDYYGNDVAKSYDMFGYFDNQRQKQEAIKNQEINRQMALDELFRIQQKHPLEMRQMELGNLTREAQLPGIKADSDMRARDRDVRAGIPIDVETKQALLKATTEMSNNEWTQTQNAIKQLMVSESPSQRQVGEMLYSMMPDMVKQREQLASREEIAAMRREAEQERQRAITERAAEATRRKEQEKSSLDNMMEQINKKRTAAEKIAQIRTYLGMLATDDPRRMALMRAEAELLPQYNAEAQARAAGKQIFNQDTGRFESPQGITLSPRNPDTPKADPLGIR